MYTTLFPSHSSVIEMHRLPLILLVCGLCLRNEEAWAQAEKSTGKPLSGTIESEPSLPVPYVQDVLVTPDLSSLEEAPKATSRREDRTVTWFEAAPVYKGVSKKSGGPEGLMRFIRQNLRWPTEAPQEGGRVFVSFVVDASGSIRDAKVMKGLHPAMDIEALRVVQLLGY
jgi:outer membrane biosynthesis protein TonB